MSFSQSTLKQIQQAGRALFDAHKAVSADVQANGASVMSSIAANPFAPENDDAYKRVRNLARIAHDIQAMETQLKTLYDSISDAQTADLPLLVAMPAGQGAQTKSQADTTNVEDATIKTETERKPFTAKKPRTSGNEAKVKTYLSNVLDRRSWKQVTHASIAKSAEIPLGSVGASLNRLKTVGWLKEDKKGSYRLA